MFQPTNRALARQQAPRTPASWEATEPLDMGGAQQYVSFPRKLYDLIEAEPNYLIEWATHGKSFFIRDQDEFCVQVLAKYFRHTKLTSFQRQLNLYGFRRITKGPDKGAYSHLLFSRDNPKHVDAIKRVVRKGARWWTHHHGHQKHSTSSSPPTTGSTGETFPNGPVLSRSSRASTRIHRGHSWAHLNDDKVDEDIDEVGEEEEAEDKEWRPTKNYYEERKGGKSTPVSLSNARFASNEVHEDDDGTGDAEGNGSPPGSALQQKLSRLVPTVLMATAIPQFKRELSKGVGGHSWQSQDFFQHDVSLRTEKDRQSAWTEHLLRENEYPDECATVPSADPAAHVTLVVNDQGGNVLGGEHAVSALLLPASGSLPSHDCPSFRVMGRGGKEARDCLRSRSGSAEVAESDGAHEQCGETSSAALRRDFWTGEEEAYAWCLIRHFEHGLLSIPPGTSLRSFLAEKLHCDPMRISKKFAARNMHRHRHEVTDWDQVSRTHSDHSLKLQHRGADVDALEQRVAELASQLLASESRGDEDWREWVAAAGSLEGQLAAKRQRLEHEAELKEKDGAARSTAEHLRVVREGTTSEVKLAQMAESCSALEREGGDWARAEAELGAHERAFFETSKRGKTARSKSGGRNMANEQGGVSRGKVGRRQASTASTTSFTASSIRTSSTLTSSKASPSSAKVVSRSSALSASVSKWACHKCTFLNRSAIAVCSMCRTPWQAPFVSPIPASILAATTPVFPLPVPRGFKVVGQDAEGFWSFEKDHARSDQPPPFFRHRLLYSSSCLPNSSSSSLLSSLPTAPLKRSRACDNNGTQRDVGLVANTYFMENSISPCPFLPPTSSSPATRLNEFLECRNIIKSKKSVEAIRNSSSFVVIDNGVVIEELAVSRDEVDSFEITSFESPWPYPSTTGTVSLKKQGSMRALELATSGGTSRSNKKVISDSDLLSKRRRITSDYDGKSFAHYLDCGNSEGSQGNCEEEEVSHCCFGAPHREDEQGSDDECGDKHGDGGVCDEGSVVDEEAGIGGDYSGVGGSGGSKKMVEGATKAERAPNRRKHGVPVRFRFEYVPWTKSVRIPVADLGGVKRKRNWCEELGCDKSALGITNRCITHGDGTHGYGTHGYGTRCEEPGCYKGPVGLTNRCKAHGEGKRCEEPGCYKGAADSTGRCKAHGEGKRCEEPGCYKGAAGSTGRCKAHGGGKQCEESDCDKSAIGSTGRCIAHGGFKQCEELSDRDHLSQDGEGAANFPDSVSSANKFSISTYRCVAHGNGERCEEPGCDKSAADSTGRCRMHGGGKWCEELGCDKYAQGLMSRCIEHGEGKRCEEPGCVKTAARESTSRCAAHGGGKQCEELGCGKYAQGSTMRCKAHGGGKRCEELGCYKGAAGSTSRCIAHGGGKRCEELGCGKSAQGSTGRCMAHGGGKRCEELGCGKSARGLTSRCRAHGGGRCEESGCDQSAASLTGRCRAHGGGKRCEELGCGKSAQGSTGRCIAHGGGKRCEELGCRKYARGSTSRCIAHGGGKRCEELGCGKSAEGLIGRCITHGGGKRCEEPGCDMSAQGSTSRCAKHGGRKRCEEPGCDNRAQGATGRCKTHGKGKRCEDPGCDNRAAGSTGWCITHWKGMRCEELGCYKGAEGSTSRCIAHGKGKRCEDPGCDNRAAGSTGGA